MSPYLERQNPAFAGLEGGRSSNFYESRRVVPADFDRSAHGLKPVHVEVICGMVYICLAGDPPDLTRYREAVTPYIAPHMPERTQVAFEMTLIEDANWKLVIENNRECYQCAGNHPELLVTLVEFALPGDPRGSACSKLLADFTEPDLGSVRMFRVPNNWNPLSYDRPRCARPGWFIRMRSRVSITT